LIRRGGGRLESPGLLAEKRNRDPQRGVGGPRQEKEVTSLA
jgi:hypothetical protein